METINPCEIGCEVCENLIGLLSEEKKDLEYARRNRQEIAEKYLAKFGSPEMLGLPSDISNGIMEVRSAILELWKEKKVLDK